jgi:hypothetical protein
MFCLLCPVLPLSLDYHFLIGPSVVTMFCLLCPVLSVSLGYQLLIGSSVFTQCSVCCAQCYLCLLVISYWLAHRFSYNVLFVVPSVTCVSGLSIFDWAFGFHTLVCLLCSVLPLSLDYHFLIGSSVFTQCSVCCAQCCLCLLVISYWLALRFSHNVLSVLPSVACVSWLSVIDWPIGFHTMFCLLCPVLPLSLDYHFLIGPSVVTMFCLLCPVLPVSIGYQLLIGSSVFTQCSVCCAQCYLCLLVISYWLAHRFSYNVLFVVPSVACVSWLSQETHATLGTTDRTLCENRRANQ